MAKLRRKQKKYAKILLRKHVEINVVLIQKILLKLKSTMKLLNYL